MKHLSLFTGLLTTFLFPIVAVAEPLLQPCGTLTRSTTLKGDCAAPLIVGASNIKIDLNRFSIKPGPVESNQPFISMVNRHGVTVTNGKVARSCGDCANIGIQGGYSNRVTNMSLYVGEIAGIGVLLSETDRNVIQNIEVRGGGTAAVQGFGSHNLIDRVTIEGLFYPAISISGNNNRITRNRIRNNIEQFHGATGVINIGISGDKNVVETNKIRCAYGNFPDGPRWGVLTYENSSSTSIKNNSIERCNIGVLAEGGATVIEGNKISNSGERGIWANGTGMIIRSNNVHNSQGTDMVDINTDCRTNTWSLNSFSTDSEGDGPNAGCIR